MARKVALTGSHGANQLQRGLLDGKLGRCTHKRKDSERENDNEAQEDDACNRRNKQSFSIARTDELTIRLATDVNYHW